MPSDASVLVVVHSTLGLLFAWCLFAEGLAKFRAGRGSVNLTLTRGEKSMGMLAGLFGSSFGLFVFAVDLAESVHGHKSFLIASDFVVLLYLFFFNSRFRNQVFGAVQQLAKESR